MHPYHPSRRLAGGLAVTLILAALIGTGFFFGPFASQGRDAQHAVHRPVVGSAVPLPGENDPAESAAAERSRPAADAMDRKSGIIRALQALAARDPQGALISALNETDEELRTELFQAVLRGWAGVDVEAAGDWARSQDFVDHGLAMAAVFNGAARQPSEAVRYARMISREDPQRTRDYGVYLIFALGQTGHHEKAVAYAVEGTPALAVEWVNAAYNRWGQRNPKHALASAVKTDAALRHIAFCAVISGWAQANPQALASHAMHFPAGAEKDYSLIVALRSWIGRDPGAAADWIEAHRGAVASIPGFETILED